MDSAFFLVAYVLLPAVVVYLCGKYAWLDKLGAVILCYLVGLILGVVGPEGPAVDEVKNTVGSAAVALALPLLLFSVNVGEWRRVAGKTAISMALGFVAVVTAAGAGFFLLRNALPSAWQLGGMAVGLYTGGTPNLAALRTALAVDADLYIAVHTYDTVIGLSYLLFASALAKPLFSRFLPRFDPNDAAAAEQANAAHVEARVSEQFDGLLRRGTLVPLLGAFSVSAAIVGVSVGIGGLFPPEHADAATILAITTLAVAASFVPRLRRIERTFAAGMYLIYVFCIAVGSMADFRGLLEHWNWPLLGFLGLAVFGSLFLHAGLARLFRIDADTVIITSVAFICSPPFVPGVANALKNRAVLLPGLYAGIAGYAMGNFAGVAMAYALRALS
ncbi:MAG: DUF819 family protein [Bacillota bacterium]|nr:hypothetical protein [Bacillota bacterium]